MSRVKRKHMETRQEERSKKENQRRIEFVWKNTSYEMETDYLNVVFAIKNLKSMDSVKREPKIKL